MPNLIYLAQPYSHADEIVRQTRFQVARAVTARLIRSGQPVFSPIVHGVTVDGLIPVPERFSHDMWMRQCVAMLRHASHMYVLPLVGWRESRGLTEELALAKTLGIPVSFLRQTDTWLPDTAWKRLEALSAEELVDRQWGLLHV